MHPSAVNHRGVRLSARVTRPDCDCYDTAADGEALILRQRVINITLRWERAHKADSQPARKKIRREKISHPRAESDSLSPQRLTATCRFCSQSARTPEFCVTSESGRMDWYSLFFSLLGLQTHRQAIFRTNQPSPSRVFSLRGQQVRTHLPRTRWDTKICSHKNVGPLSNTWIRAMCGNGFLRDKSRFRAAKFEDEKTIGSRAGSITAIVAFTSDQTVSCIALNYVVCGDSTYEYTKPRSPGLASWQGEPTTRGTLQATLRRSCECPRVAWCDFLAVALGAG